MKRPAMDLRAIESDETRVTPFVAALEGTDEPCGDSDGSSWDPQFAASGKAPASVVPGRWPVEEFVASGKMEGKGGLGQRARWMPPFTASGKAIGKPTG